MGKTLKEWKIEIEAEQDRKLSKNENEFLDNLTDILDRLDWKDALNAKDLSLLENQILTIEKNQQSLSRMDSGKSSLRTSIRFGSTLPSFSTIVKFLCRSFSSRKPNWMKSAKTFNCGSIKKKLGSGRTASAIFPKDETLATLAISSYVSNYKDDHSNGKLARLDSLTIPPCPQRNSLNGWPKTLASSIDSLPQASRSAQHCFKTISDLLNAPYRFGQGRRLFLSQCPSP